MYIARLICSDDECSEEFEARAATLAELETLACECGCALEVLAWPDEAPDPGEDTELVPLGAVRLRVLA